MQTPTTRQRLPLRRQPGLALAAVCAACIALAGCDGASLSGAIANTPKHNTEPVREGNFITVPEASPLRARLQVQTVVEQALERPIEVPGTIEPDAARLVKIVPPMPGRIVRLHAALGDTVRKGDPLFTLDSAELSAAQGEASKARAALLEAKLNLDRQRTLFEAEIAARKDYEQAQLAYAQANSDAVTTAAQLAQLGAGTAPQSHRQYTMHAPLAGRVIELEGAQGGFWNDNGAPVMTVADLSTVYLAASVSEKDIASIFVGQPAEILLNAYPGKPVTGKVRYIGEILDPDTRTVKVRVAIDNADGRYRPGLFAKVTFAGEKHAALLVPPSALLQSGLYTRVLVEKAPLRFEPRVVTTGAHADGQVEILAGLKAGERIVVKNGVLLHD
ncbi:efflux RND transporter periplasmic adaptor subunit [Cupriavidus basilensis]|uniref:Cobalt/zinc/cadmium efflux RND transporter, membrane fusion protein, CzcB family n=1 Tax=Cupriavidus basilensis TaxID=68895 RepID=A0A0C4YLI7_9BURK|nr:efflux RND transporter periplasmic adaptor subunit [Cupriavidus basilensis]AJG22884.1 Cobalt/zinc/cadmium efflux RND transporter, membrane fusion protein, CzcB family [Cupriavidus basilensis]